MANLIPEVRVNKLGVPVTKHVKADAPAARKSAIPSPGLTASPTKKPRKLLPRQTRVNNLMLDRANYSPPSNSLDKVLRLPVDQKTYSYAINDEAAYGMFSAMSIGNALRMINSGYKTKESAVEFLKSNGLRTLIQDNSSLMQEALVERRIPAADFVEFCSSYDPREHSPETFLDAAEAYSSGTLRAIEKEEVNSVHIRVLAGELSLKDIKTVGYSKIQHSNAARQVINSLQLMHDGKLDCTAEDIRHLIDQSDGESNLPHKTVWALDSINKYGVDLLKSNKIYRAFDIEEKSPNRSVDEIKSLMEYDRVMVAQGAYVHPVAADRLQKEGVDPVVAGKLYKEKLTVDQIIGTHQDEVPAAITSGWL